jgi:hypothetical protein
MYLYQLNKEINKYSCQGIDTIPSKLVVFMVKATHGQYTTNPYYFEHVNLQCVDVLVNGKKMDSINCDFDKYNYVEGYRSLSKVYPECLIKSDEFYQG